VPMILRSRGEQPLWADARFWQARCYDESPLPLRSVQNKRDRFRHAGPLPMLYQLTTLTDVRLWHKADITIALNRVRFRGQSGQGADVANFRRYTRW
jgi:hypothetical protein